MKYKVTKPVVRSMDQDQWAVGDIVELPEGSTADYLEPVEDAAPKKRSTKKNTETASAAAEVETATTA